MQTYPIQSILDSAQQVLAQCRLEGRAGTYRRALTSDPVGDAAATAAAVNIHYMLDQLPWEPEIRQQWIQTLNEFQNSQTGLFTEGPHALSVSAACTGALSCFGCLPAVDTDFLSNHLDPSELSTFLHQLEWCKDPEASAREACAMFTLLVLTRKVNTEWRDRFMQWIGEETDEHTGLLRKGCIAPIELDGEWTLLPYLCAILYPIAVCGYCHHPLSMPWRLVDTALEVMEFHRELFFKRRGHRHLPWIFCLSRAMRQSPHRHEEARQALQRFVPAYVDYLHRQIQDGHFQRPVQIQWDLAALAELQLSVPGMLQSDHPLRQVLDRHPFL